MRHLGLLLIALISTACLAAWLTACSAAISSEATPSTTIIGTALFEGSGDDLSPGFTVEAVYPHDPAAYTQGLEFLDEATLVESTGLRGSSTLRVVDAPSGEALEVAALPSSHFGEGATIIESGGSTSVWQLTWQEGIATRWSLEPLAATEQVSYDGEGWGLCAQGGRTADRLVMSDGSATLTFRSSADFSVQSTIDVTDRGVLLTKINELECVGGEVWANVYQTNWIVVIDTTTGEVTRRYDLSSLVPETFIDSTEFVLNGIAYHEPTDRFWVTGKQWPVMYELSFDRESD